MSHKITVPTRVDEPSPAIETFPMRNSKPSSSLTSSTLFGEDSMMSRNTVTVAFRSLLASIAVVLAFQGSNSARAVVVNVANGAHNHRRHQ